jgi:hypothetical protein
MSTAYTGTPEWESEVIKGKHGGYSSRCIVFFNPYQNIFKDLKWWEERNEKDMPLYLKRVKKEWTLVYNNEEEPEVHKVLAHFTTSCRVDDRFASPNSFVSEWFDNAFNYMYFVPATEAEYKAYMETRKAK